MLVLGIDPGTATTGYGFVREDEDGTLTAVAYGVITTAAGVAMPQRLREIYDSLGQLLRKYQPEQVAIEQLFFGKNVTTGITVAQARGVMLLAVEQAGLPIAEYKPLQVKQAISGYGGADKMQVQLMIQQLLNLDSLPRPDDAADALGIALTHLNMTRFERMMD